MSKPDFVYVTYIASTPETVWNALRDPELTKFYWAGQRNVSTWEPGAPWRHEDYEDASRLAIVGTVLESDPPKRLVMTWADPDDANDPSKVSRVTFDIAPYQDGVRLQVTHDGLDAEMLQGISYGWPVVLSSLKTLLETGSALTWTGKSLRREKETVSNAS